MNKYNVGDVVCKPLIRGADVGLFIVKHITISTDFYVLYSLDTNQSIGTYGKDLISDFCLAMSSPKVYTGPLTQEEIDEIIESYNNSVQAIPDQITLPYGYDFGNVDFEDRNYGDTGFVYGEPPKLSCKHEFVGVQLLISTVYNCKKCGIKKEDV